MAGFSASWLDLREPADAASRSQALVHQLAAHLEPMGRLRIADLGAGTGSNLRWLAPRIGNAQHWHLLDSDPELIDSMSARLRAWASRHNMGARQTCSGLTLDGRLQVTWDRIDLSLDPLPTDRLGSAPVHLVTASALVDLVSADWLDRLAQRCAQHASAVLLAISYDGRIRLEPPHALDARVREALNRHQLQDKGFGPALGPDCAALASAVFRRRGYRVVQARSDWRLAAADRELAQALLDGWLEAAKQILDPDAHAVLDRWHTWRTQTLSDPRAGLHVGHVDLLALP